jgi:hypothetical protein
MPGAVLRVGGSKAAIRRVLASSSLKPHRVYIKGEPTSQGSPILAKSSYFLVMASNAEGDKFPRQVSEVRRFLVRYAKDLRALRRAKLHAVIDFGVYDLRTSDRPLQSWRVDTETSKLLGTLGVDLEISIYAR